MRWSTTSITFNVLHDIALRTNCRASLTCIALTGCIGMDGARAAWHGSESEGVLRDKWF